MKKFKQHFSSMDNCFYDEEIEKTIIGKNRDKIKNWISIREIHTIRLLASENAKTYTKLWVLRLANGKSPHFNGVDESERCSVSLWGCFEQPFLVSSNHECEKTINYHSSERSIN